MTRHISWIVLPLFFCFLLGVSAAQQTGITRLPSPNERWALVVGIGKYDDSNWGTLYGDRDAEKLADALEQYGDFLKDHITVLSNRNDRQPATIRNFITELQRQLSKVPQSGLLLVAFSGHGVQVDGKPFLIMSDTPNSDLKMSLGHLAMPVDELATAIEESNVGQVIVLLDACREEIGKTGERTTLSPELLKAFDLQQLNSKVVANAVLSATSPNQTAFQSETKQMGFFTSAVVDAFAGQGFHGDVLTLGDLIRYVETNVPRNVEQEYPGRQQKPSYSVRGYLAADLVLAGRRASQDYPVIPDAVFPLVAQRPGKAIEYEIAKSFWTDANVDDIRNRLHEFEKSYPRSVYLAEVFGVVAERLRPVNLADSIAVNSEALERFPFDSLLRLQRACLSLHSVKPDKGENPLLVDSARTDVVQIAELRGAIEKSAGNSYTKGLALELLGILKILRSDWLGAEGLFRGAEKLYGANVPATLFLNLALAQRKNKEYAASADTLARGEKLVRTTPVITETLRRESNDARRLLLADVSFAATVTVIVGSGTKSGGASLIPSINSDSDVEVVLNDNSVNIASLHGQGLPLKEGTNNLEVWVVSKGLYIGGSDILHGRRPIGWSYDLALVESKSGKPILHFADREDVPNPAGPRFGRRFRVASATLEVDTKSNEIKVLSAVPHTWAPSLLPAPPVNLKVITE